MKSLQLIITFITLFIAIGAVRGEERSKTLICNQAVEKFLSDPGEQSLKVLEIQGNNACWPVVDSTNDRLNRLFALVEKGDVWSSKYLTMHLNKLDGGNLEDGLIALGQFSDHHPAGLLELAKNGYLSDRYLSAALTMLPLSLSDDPAAQLKAMRDRRNRIAAVGENGLKDERLKGLKSIDAFIEEIDVHK